MNRDEALVILSNSKEELREKFGVKSIAVFGSMARNEARSDSDVDVLVEFEEPVGFFTLAKVQFFLEDALGIDVDLATPGSLKSPVRERVYKDLIYAS
jgi:predicted nucleotidyltransferase